MLCELLREADRRANRGGLVRGSLHSRRVLWLCPDHLRLARGTIENDVLDSDDLALSVPATTNKTTTNGD